LLRAPSLGWISTVATTHEASSLNDRCCPLPKIPTTPNYLERLPPNGLDCYNTTANSSPNGLKIKATTEQAPSTWTTTCQRKLEMLSANA